MNNLLSSFLNSSKHEFSSRPASERKNVTIKPKPQSQKRILDDKQSHRKSIGLHPVLNQSSTARSQEYLKSQYIRKILYQNKILLDDLNRLRQIEILYLKQKQSSENWKKLALNFKNKYSKLKEIKNIKNETEQFPVLQDLSSIEGSQAQIINETNLNKLKERQLDTLQLIMKKFTQENEDKSSQKSDENINFNHQSFHQNENNWNFIQNIDNKFYNIKLVQENQLERQNKQQKEKDILKKNNNGLEKIIQQLKNQKKINASLQIQNKKLKQRISILQNPKIATNNHKSGNLNRSQSIYSQNQSLKKKVEKLSESLQKEKQTVEKIRGLISYGELSTPHFKFK